MSRSNTRWIVWIALALSVPLPFFSPEQSWVPAVFSAQVATYALGFLVSEGTGLIGYLVLLIVLQALLSLGVLYWGAGALVSRLADPKSDQVSPGRLASLVAVALLVTLLPTYASPLVRAGMASNLVQILS